MRTSRGPVATNSTAFWVAATWSSVAVTTFAVRWWRRRSSLQREQRVANDGGLLGPTCRNCVHALQMRAKEHPDQVALVGASGKTSYTWAQYYQQVQQFARALNATTEAITMSDTSITSTKQQWGVAVHAFNEPRWFFSAIGALAAGWTVSGIYLTNTYAQAAHVIKTSEVQVLVVESKEAYDSVYADKVLKEFPNLTVVILQDDDTIKKLSMSTSDRVISYAAFLERGKTSLLGLRPPEQLHANAISALVYTSGTTGNPKAVELTHESIATVCTMMHARIPLNSKTVVVSYLPLSHIAAMGIDIFSSLFCGARVHFADAQALQGSLKDTLLQVRPTLFFGVPRVWEKMAVAMQSAAAKNYQKRGTGKILKAIGTAAKTVGSYWWRASTPEWVRCGLLVFPYTLFQALVYRKVRKGCGLDRCNLLYTGAAPLSADVLLYLRSVNMPLLEVFGMSESTGAIAVCGPTDAARPLGACGRGLPKGEIHIADDSEILWRGNNTMVGYKGLAAATEAAIDPKTKYLHTGDIGKVDDQGYLYITGRKKEILITAGGENVAPQPIEEALMSLLNKSTGSGSRSGHVVLVGDQRKFLTVLIAPTDDKNDKQEGIAGVEQALAAYNQDYAKSRAQRVQKAHVLDEPLTVQTGELTPTMKVKRAFVVEKYAKEIEDMYAAGSNMVGYSSMKFGRMDSSTIA